MKKDGFYPQEILFSPTLECNLNCPHCDIQKQPGTLDIKSAIAFLRRCARSGIERVGFTGGEPFLTLDFLVAVTREALHNNMLFGRITTNGVWFKNKSLLIKALKRLYAAGYDGDIMVSVDAFHAQDLRKVATFIRVVSALWSRPQMVTIAAVRGAREADTLARLKRLAFFLRARLYNVNGRPALIKNKDIFIRIAAIDLSSVGKAVCLKNPWGSKWFKDDFCKGPGNIFFVMPDGKVAPCCGYANDHNELAIGTIKDSPKILIRNARTNRFVAAVFTSGLHAIRKKLENSGIKFPGKTTDHCFFCRYLLDLGQYR